jgi:hypothetical protein
MSTYQYALTPRQLSIRDAVCSRARTLHDRVRELAHRASYGPDDERDIAAVREWLFTVHHAELRRPQPAGVQR